MKVIRHLVHTQVEDGNYVYINTLNGSVDIFTDEVHQLIQKWKNSQVIIDSPLAKDVAIFIDKRDYLVETDEEEELLLEELYQQLRADTEKSQHEVTQLTFVLTYDCNFRCPYCYEDYLQKKGEKWVKKTMTKEMVDQIADHYSDHVKWVTLFGGEPLLEENWDLVEYIMKKMRQVAPDVGFAITTNGYTLEQYVPLIKKYDDAYIEVSLDGSKELHNQRRCLANGEGTYEKILTGIEEALENDFTVLLRMNVDQANFDACEQFIQKSMIKYSKYTKFSLRRIPVFSTSNKKACCSNTITRLFESELHKNHAEDFYSSLEHFHEIGKVFQGTGQWSPKYVFCSAHKSLRLFDPHGMIYSCWLALGNEELCVGKYFPENKSGNGLPWFERTVETMTPCKDCEKALLCGGSCALGSYREHGDLLIGNCSQVQILLDKVIPYLYKKYVLKEVAI